MNQLEIGAASVAIAGALVCIIGVVRALSRAQSLGYKTDVAPAKGSAAAGVTYAFSTGLAPWAKESTRRHLVAYMRGIGFHLSIFAALVMLLASPWMESIPAPVRTSFAGILASGTVLALAGYWIRFREEALRVVSTYDDCFSLGLVTAFLASATASAVVDAAVPAMWILTGVVLAYLPFGKLKHSIYFFYTRTFFGAFFGYRGVLEVARRVS